MGTRAVYTVQDGPRTYHVYLPFDGYPAGALQQIERALEYSWDRPAGDDDGTSAPCPTTHWRLHGDLEYRYELRSLRGELHVQAFDLRGGEQMLFDGPLAAFRYYAAALARAA